MSSGNASLDSRFTISATIAKGSWGSLHRMGSKVKSDFFDVHVLAHTLSSQDALYGIAAELGEGLVELQKHPIPYVAKCIETNAHTKEANSGTLYALYRPAFSPEHSLRGQLLRHEYLTTDVVCFYAAQLLLLLKDLHKRNLCCRLLDKDHIFIDDEGLVCVMDPTLSLSASVFFEPRVHAVTASEYSLVPPECRTYMNARDKGVALPTGAEAETINKSADFWRLGCLIFELAVGLPPFRPQLTEIQAAALRQRRQSLGMPQLLAQSQGCLHFPRSLPSSLRDFLLIALMADSVARLKNMSVISHHQFFDNLDFTDLASYNPNFHLKEEEIAVRLGFKDDLQMKVPTAPIPPILYKPLKPSPNLQIEIHMKMKANVQQQLQQITSSVSEDGNHLASPAGTPGTSPGASPHSNVRNIASMFSGKTITRGSPMSRSPSSMQPRTIELNEDAKASTPCRSGCGEADDTPVVGKSLAESPSRQDSREDGGNKVDCNSREPTASESSKRHTAGTFGSPPPPPSAGAAGRKHFLPPPPPPVVRTHGHTVPRPPPPPPPVATLTDSGSRGDALPMAGPRLSTIPAGPNAVAALAALQMQLGVQKAPPRPSLSASKVPEVRQVPDAEGYDSSSVSSVLLSAVPEFVATAPAPATISPQYVPGQLVLEGMLLKKSPTGLFKVWQPRYFKLYPHVINYYKESSKTGATGTPQGSIPLHSIKFIHFSKKKEGCRFDIIVGDSSIARTFALQSATAEDAELWVKVVSALLLQLRSTASYDSCPNFNSEEKFWKQTDKVDKLLHRNSLSALRNSAQQDVLRAFTAAMRANGADDDSGSSPQSDLIKTSNSVIDLRRNGNQLRVTHFERSTIGRLYMVKDRLKANSAYLLHTMAKSSPFIVHGRQLISQVLKIDHPYIGKAAAHGETSDAVFVLYHPPCVNKYSFHELLRIHGRFPEKVVRFFAAQLVLVIAYLHSQGIHVTTLSMNRVFLSNDGNICFFDEQLSAAANLIKLGKHEVSSKNPNGTMTRREEDRRGLLTPELCPPEYWREYDKAQSEYKLNMQDPDAKPITTGDDEDEDKKQNTHISEDALPSQLPSPPLVSGSSSAAQSSASSSSLKILRSLPAPPAAPSTSPPSTSPPSTSLPLSSSVSSVSSLADIQTKDGDSTSTSAALSSSPARSLFACVPDNGVAAVVDDSPSFVVDGDIIDGGARLAEKGAKKTRNSDWWRLGCLLYEMVIGLPVFRVDVKQMKQIFEKRKLEAAVALARGVSLSPADPVESVSMRSIYCDLICEQVLQFNPDCLQFPPWVSDSLQDLIKKLLAPEVKQRLGAFGDRAEAVKGHDFFQGAIEWNNMHPLYRGRLLSKAMRAPGYVFSTLLEPRLSNLGGFATGAVPFAPTVPENLCRIRKTENWSIQVAVEILRLRGLTAPNKGLIQEVYSVEGITSPDVKKKRLKDMEMTLSNYTQPTPFVEVRCNGSKKVTHVHDRVQRGHAEFNETFLFQVSTTGPSTNLQDARTVDLLVCYEIPQAQPITLGQLSISLGDVEAAFPLKVTGWHTLLCTRTGMPLTVEVEVRLQWMETKGEKALNDEGEGSKGGGKDKDVVPFLNLDKNGFSTVFGAVDRRTTFVRPTTNEFISRTQDGSEAKVNLYKKVIKTEFDSDDDGDGADTDDEDAAIERELVEGDQENKEEGESDQGKREAKAQSGLFAKIRGLVSKRKKRFQLDGFDLDLSYVTPFVIAMGFPSEGKEGLYRNPMEEVQKFFEKYHRGHFKVYNLCSEKKYEHDKFHCLGGHVGEYCFDDHNAPPFDLLLAFCRDVHEFLTADPLNVVAIHCKAGKGRTGTVISAYLLYSRIAQSAHQALLMFAQARTSNAKGVTIPSQMRYVWYFEEFLKRQHVAAVRSCGSFWPVNPQEDLETATDGGIAKDAARVPIFLSPVVPEVPLKLTHIRMSPVPKFDISGGCSPYFRVFGPVPLRPELFNMKVDMPDAIEEYSKERSECILSLGDGCTLYGDCLITFYQLSLYLSKDTHMFHFWINTSFINNYYLSLDKSQLDGPNKDHKNAFFAEDFKLELYFAPINYVLVEGE